MTDFSMTNNTIAQSAYNTFIDRVKSNQIRQVTIKPNRIEYQLKAEFGGESYYTQLIQSKEELSRLLESHDVTVNIPLLSVW
jgi:ATP-dependent Zn protease